MTLTQEIIAKYNVVRPDWMPPHRIPFIVAKRHRLPCKVNGKGAEFWSAKRLAKMVDDIDFSLDRPLKVVIGDEKFTLVWVDIRKLRVK